MEYEFENDDLDERLASSLTVSKSKASGKGKKKSTATSSTSARQPFSAVNSNSSNQEDHGNAEEEGKSIEDIYQKKTPLEHILLRPDTYVGSIEKITQPMWVYDQATESMVNRQVTYVPGLYKIFDEILVNAADNKQRDASMDALKVHIDVNEGSISVWNNGQGIPISMHKEYQVYVPELIFGHLLTGSNFNDKKRKTTGGRNGYGAKLANIFSTQFVVETGSKSQGQHYRQVFRSNMSEKEKPTIKKYSKEDFTCVTFFPDLARFQMTHLDDDIVSLMMKRVYDIAGVTTGKLSVSLQNQKLKISKFPQYVSLYKQPASQEEEDGDDADDVKKGREIIYEKADDRWQIGIGCTDDGFQQVSFVNSIATTKGGQHVNYILDQVITKLVATVKKKNKGDAIKPAYVKNHLFIFVSALIENPAFDSQTKENLTTRPSAFGSKHELSDEFLKKVEKSGVVDKILQYAKYKQNAQLKRKTGGKQRKITGIAKLDDANCAGTAKGKDCTLILTEGDSAKALAMSGVSVVGRDLYGVFPLKGKLLNVREASHAMILKNEEIQNIIKILGLKIGQAYDSVSSLRYGHLMIMADQDHDGSHIKGLVINFIHHYWPSLMKIDGFLQEFITPIVKATKGKNRSQVFYTMPEYEHWKEETVNERGWSIKYYKGLGTSTAKEAKDYFSDLNTHQIDFCYGNEQDSDAIDMAFSKKRVEDRKNWLREYQPGSHVDYDVAAMPYKDFVDKELILFSMADNIRSIPCFLDGLKPSQRKVLFACFKRNLKHEIKVAQLAGYVSEHSAYHHGEMSLTSTIINMAQNFIGTNNIHLLTPSGQFGTRLLGGKDAASPRYVFTKLEKITRMIFNPLDDPVLHFCEEDGQKIEPNFYVPILPMALVNGSDGIGTGWSTGIPNYNPLDIIAYLRWKLGGSVTSEKPSRLRPWYRGFTGEILVKNATTYLMRGTYELLGDDTMVITELPVKSWTQQYKQFLETLIADHTIKDFKENHTDTSVHFTIQFTTAEMLSRLRSKTGALEKKMKLESSLAISNMHMFNAQGCIQKYTSPEEVMEEFFPIRLEYYDRRKAMMLQKLRDERKMLENKTRFIEGVITGELVIHNRRKSNLLSMLREHQFDCIVPSSSSTGHATEHEHDDDPEEQDTTTNTLTRGYDYLLSMKLWSLTNERIEKLRTEFREKVVEHDTLERTSVEALWTRDLTELLTELSHAEEGRLVDQAEALVAQSRATSLRTKKAKKTQKKKPVKHNKPATAVVLNDSEDAATEPRAKTLKKKNKLTLIETSTSVIPKHVTKRPEAADVDSVEEEEELSLSERMKLKRQKPKEKLKQAMMDEEEEEEEDISSLSQQLSRKMHVTPKKKIQQQPPGVSENEESEESEDDVFALKKKKKENPKKRAKEQTPKKLHQNVLTAAKSPYRKSPKLKKIKSKASPMKARPGVGEVSPEAKGMMIPDRRPARAGRNQVVYDLQDSDDESQEEEEEESFFSEEDEGQDEDSDFEDE